MKTTFVPVIALLALGFASADCTRKEKTSPDDPRNSVAVPMGGSVDEKDQSQQQQGSAPANQQPGDEQPYKEGAQAQP